MTSVPSKAGSPYEEPNSIRDKLLKAVENAKKGDRRELGIMIQFVARDKSVNITEEMLPDFISFLKDKDGQVQLLGAHGLYALKSPKSKKALFEYLKGKDFAKLKEMATTGTLDERRAARWESQASVIAITMLGKLGDKSAIPLLESIRQKTNIELEWGYSPVEETLAELGALEILSNIPPGSDEKQIRRAAGAIRKIKDPNKVPELIAIVYDGNCAVPIRDSALAVVAETNTIDVTRFLLRVINDSQIPVLMKRTAVIAAAQTGNEIFEEKLLEIANSDSEIRLEGLHGLAILKPDKYMKNIFETIKDVNESDEFRVFVAGMLYIPQQLRKDQKVELYDCLNNAIKKDGSPHDEIRIRMWCFIHELFDEEPHIILGNKSSIGISTIKSMLREKIQQQWRNEPWNEPHIEELNQMADEKFKSIVTFLPED